MKKALITGITILALLSCSNSNEKTAEQMNNEINAKYEEQQRINDKIQRHIQNSKDFLEVGAIDEAKKEQKIVDSLLKVQEEFNK